MKKFKTLKTSWFLGAVIAAVFVGEAAATFLQPLLPFHLSGVTVAAMCVGLVAVATSLLYDGHD